MGRSKSIPDLSIEVVFTSGGVNKLTRYQALGVPEVWFWQDGAFALYHLGVNGYQSIERSRLPGLETLDLELLNRCVLMSATNAAEPIRTFRNAISS